MARFKNPIAAAKQFSKDVVKEAKFRSTTRKKNRRTKDILDTAASVKARKKFKSKKGDDITPSSVKTELESGKPTAETKEFLKGKRKIRKGLKNRIGL